MSARAPGPAPVPHRFVRSTLASYASLFVRLTLTFLARMALARLVLPGAHGTYDLALRVVTVAGAIRDLGLPYQLMRDPRRPYGTVFAFGALSSVGMTVLLFFGAPLAAGFAPELPPVLRVFALWILLDGIAVVPRTFFERELEIHRLVLPEIARGVVVAGLSVALAARGFGVWSLVDADLAGAALYAATVWWRARGRVPLAVEPRLLWDLLRRSRALFLIWVVYYLVTYVDSFIVRAIADVSAVGQYGRAYFLAFLMRQIVFPRALLPALVEYRADRDKFAEAFRAGMVFLMFCEVTTGYFLFFNAASVVDLYLGPQWRPAVALLKILCFVPFLDVFSELGGEILKVRDEDRLWLTVVSLNLASLVLFGVLFTRRWGPTGMAWANFLLFGTPLMAWRLARLFSGHFGALLRDMALIYVVPLAFFGSVALACPPGLPRLGLSVAAGLGAAWTLYLRFRPLFARFLSERAARSAGVTE